MTKSSRSSWVHSSVKANVWCHLGLDCLPVDLLCGHLGAPGVFSYSKPLGFPSSRFMFTGEEWVNISLGNWTGSVITICWNQSPWRGPGDDGLFLVHLSVFHYCNKTTEVIDLWRGKVCCAARVCSFLLSVAWLLCICGEVMCHGVIQTGQQSCSWWLRTGREREEGPASQISFKAFIQSPENPY